MTANPGLSLADWHQRYLQQAQWTQAIRRHLFEKADLKAGDRVLEVGSGTGAVLSQVAEVGQLCLTGIDLDRPSLTFALAETTDIDLAQADGHNLPFADGSFGAVFCHYLLLWVRDPARVLAEMRRVTRRGGYVIALAEPDHAARIDFPPTLDHLGRLQTEALKSQGVDIRMGRQLRQRFHDAGLSQVETGLLGAEWAEAPHGDDETEWMALHSDLGRSLSPAELSHYREADQKAQSSGARVLYIPTFFAFGRVL